MEKITIQQHSIFGGLWFAGWLFTLGFLPLTVLQSIFAIVIWPYYIGVAMAL